MSTTTFTRDDAEVQFAILIGGLSGYVSDPYGPLVLAVSGSEVVGAADLSVHQELKAEVGAHTDEDLSEWAVEAQGMHVEFVHLPGVEAPEFEDEEDWDF